MGPVNIKRASDRKNERGNVLAYTVLSAFFLFLAVGLGVDLSHLYLAKTELQNTADAAALAGASALKLSVPEKITTSVDRAIQVMNLNKYNFNNRNYADVMNTTDQRNLVEFSKNLDGTYKIESAMSTTEKAEARFIRVTTPSVPINTFFAIPILGFSKALNAKATAGLSVPGNLSVCPAPLSAVTCPPNTEDCNLCPLDENGVCTETKYWGNCGGANPHDPIAVEVTGGPDDPDGNGTCDPKREFCKTCTYNIRSGPQNGQGPSPGNFQILRCAGEGANAVKQALALYGTNCQCDAVSPGDEIETQTGELAGAVRAGLNVRFDVYGNGLNYGPNMPPDTNIEQGSSHGNGNNQFWDGITWEQYQGLSSPVIPPRSPANGHTGVANRRVLIIPIIPITEFTDESGNQTVRLSSLAGFFMRSQVSDGTGGDIQVEYIGDDITGVIGFDPNDNNITNIVTPVLYR
ncbi:MAG TPA: Tad domain-containing protein [Pyrinomonadaceae bacterium]|nr:Tad domain-containing protein [Pyrinomonadaceae bacterium]